MAKSGTWSNQIGCFAPCRLVHRPSRPMPRPVIFEINPILLVGVPVFRNDLYKLSRLLLDAFQQPHNQLVPENTRARPATSQGRRDFIQCRKEARQSGSEPGAVPTVPDAATTLLRPPARIAVARRRARAQSPDLERVVEAALAPTDISEMPAPVPRGAGAREGPVVGELSSGRVPRETADRVKLESGKTSAPRRWTLLRPPRWDPISG
jgi:hypothetical protein